jgi:endonuclease/exonuclease/phosphatase family metal-dependent hydrolase
MSVVRTSPKLLVTNGVARPNDTVEVVGFDAVPPARSKLGDGRTLVVHNPSAKPPAEPGVITMMSYNILLGGKRRKEILEYFDRLAREGRLPDVLGVQEAHQPISIELASRYGYHLAYFGHGDPGPPERTLVNGKAVLTRYRICEATQFTYALSDADRSASLERQRGNRYTDDEDRGVLRATIDAGDRLVDIYNTHLSYGDLLINADQLRQLRRLIASSKNESVLAGDFNVNVGNAAPIKKLDRVVKDVWRADVERVVRMPGGEMITPEAARAELASAGAPDSGAKWKLLMDAAAGTTFEGMPGKDGALEPCGQRLDGVFATPGLVPEHAELDWSTNASDHAPLFVRLRRDPDAKKRARRKLV